jgi:hypothetical protein
LYHAEADREENMIDYNGKNVIGGKTQKIAKFRTDLGYFGQISYILSYNHILPSIGWIFESNPIMSSD